MLRSISMSVIVAGLCTTCLTAQQKPATESRLEFPVIFQQTVSAGKTPVGTRVQAKLSIASLINGVVVPRNAVFSGEVVESSAKTKTTPSRLAIRMNSLNWKNGTAPIAVYLTNWYYPSMAETGQALQYGPEQGPNKSWNGQGQYPDPDSKVYRPFPGDDSNKNQSVPDTPNAVTSKNRVLMKDVAAESRSNGVIALVSTRSNIKLDKFTTYVLGASDLPAVK